MSVYVRFKMRYDVEEEDKDLVEAQEAQKVPWSGMLLMTSYL